MTFLERTMHLLCMASMEQIDFHEVSNLCVFPFSNSIILKQYKTLPSSNSIIKSLLTFLWEKLYINKS
jgi:hypothetical protein